MERVRTGISGFDELLLGGVPKGSNVLVSGGTGSGKTIFSMQYIYSGAKDYDESGLFVTVEGNLRNIMWNMESFGWDIKPLQDQNKLNIYKLNMGLIRDEKLLERKIENELDEIAAQVESINAERLVIDSTTALGSWMPPNLIRSTLYDFLDRLKDLNCTTFIVSEVPGKQEERFSTFGVEEFISDGVVALYFTPPNRSIFVRKMRGTKHSKNAHPFEITERGPVVKPADNVLWDSIFPTNR